MASKLSAHQISAGSFLRPVSTYSESIAVPPEAPKDGPAGTDAPLEPTGQSPPHARLRSLYDESLVDLISGQAIYLGHKTQLSPASLSAIKQVVAKSIAQDLAEEARKVLNDSVQSVGGLGVEMPPGSSPGPEDVSEAPGSLQPEREENPGQAGSGA